MKNYKSYLVFILILFLFFSIFQSVTAEISTEESEPNIITVEYFYDETCGSCIEKRDNIIAEAEAYYKDNDSVVFKYKEITGNNQNFQEYTAYLKKYDNLYGYPFIIIKNETRETNLYENDITINNIIEDVNAIYYGQQIQNKSEEDVHCIDFLFWDICVNTSDYSLPVLTIILGGLDSFNPCAFFILIFLLNILLYMKSRKRMLLIGGIFIFFSGLLYAIFMFILFETFLLTKQHVTIVNIIAGSIALTLGIFSIKDFFFFKKGASLSIPDDKKPKLYKQMRKLVKNPRLTATIIGTIILAASVNFYELLCTLALPLVFTKRLADYNITSGSAGYYSYIFFYNVVYVIPLIIIVLIFVYTSKKRKLTEWHGQIMKLMSGIMLSSFGILFLFNYQLLENVITPILLLLFSFLTTLLIAYIWKKFVKKEEIKENNLIE